MSFDHDYMLEWAALDRAAIEGAASDAVQIHAGATFEIVAAGDGLTVQVYLPAGVVEREQIAGMERPSWPPDERGGYVGEVTFDVLPPYGDEPAVCSFGVTSSRGANQYLWMPLTAVVDRMAGVLGGRYRDH